MVAQANQFGAQEPRGFPTEEELIRKAYVTSGDLPVESDTTLVTVVRDHWFFMPSWLEHHRTLGVNKFLVLDDGSSESFLEMLAKEKDVTVFRLPFRFGEKIQWIGAEGVLRSASAGEAYKELFGNNVCTGGVNFVLDIDEFLIIHPDFPTIQALLKFFEKSPTTIFPGQMIDMLPPYWPPPSFEDGAPTFSNLLDAYPLFLPKPAWERVGAELIWKWRVNGITELFERYRIYSGKGWKYLGRCVAWWALPKRWAFPRSDVNKLPILIKENSTGRRGPHNSVEPPDAPVLLAVLHFTMTQHLEEKVRFALSQQAGYGVSQSRYRSLGRLVRKLHKAEGREKGLRGSFVRYDNPKSLLAAGIFENPAPSWSLKGG